MEPTQNQTSQIVTQLVITNNKNATGFWNDLNQIQYDALQKFKEKLLSDNTLPDFSNYDDLYLLRFLRARKFDLTKTALMFENFLKWRTSNQVDEIEQFEFSELLQVKAIYPHGYHKTDMKGRPIYIELMSKVNLTDLFKITTEDRMMKYYIKGYERLMKDRFPSCSRTKGVLIEQSLTILDMGGVGLGMVVGKTKEFIKIASDIGQNYYPEMLGTMFLVNTSFLFGAVWSLVKGFIDEKTRNKVKVEKSDYAKKLLELVEPESLPTFFGGKCTCSHIEGGCLFSDAGPWNPEGGLKARRSKTGIII